MAFIYLFMTLFFGAYNTQYIILCIAYAFSNTEFIIIYALTLPLNKLLLAVIVSLYTYLC